MSLSDIVYMEIDQMEKQLIRFYPKKQFVRKFVSDLNKHIEAQEKPNKLSVKYILTKYAFK